LDAGHDANVPVGSIALAPEEVERWVDAGFDFQVVGIDADYLLDGASRAKRTYEEAIR